MNRVHRLKDSPTSILNAFSFNSDSPSVLYPRGRAARATRGPSLPTCRSSSRSDRSAKINIVTVPKSYRTPAYRIFRPYTINPLPIDNSSVPISYRTIKSVVDCCGYRIPSCPVAPSSRGRTRRVCRRTDSAPTDSPCSDRTCH